jgi:hypothetical protein
MGDAYQEGRDDGRSECTTTQLASLTPVPDPKGTVNVNGCEDGYPEVTKFRLRAPKFDWVRHNPF